MIITGKFQDITEQYVYYIEVGNTGVTMQIKNGDYEYNNNEDLIYFDGEAPIVISSDISDTFTNVYIRSCTVNLLCNFDIRKYVVAKYPNDIPIVIRKATVGVNDNAAVNTWTIIFKGYVNPLSFNQPFAKEQNVFSLECTDMLGILEYKKFPGLLQSYDYNTPRYFLNLALSICNLSTISYNISNDHTTDTKINPIIFIGDSENDWMSCLDVINEIGKIYGFFVWQDGNTCKVENILTLNTNNPYTITRDDYTSDDANISIDEAYNTIKCTVDISSIDETFIDPFKDEYIKPTTLKAERILTEIYVHSKQKKEGLASFKNILTMAPMTKNWSSLQISGDYLPEIYEHYAQILSNDLLDFGEHSYMTDGGGSATSGVKTTLDWLKNNPGKSAFVSLGMTDNLIQVKNKSAVTMADMKKKLIIQVGGHGADTSAENDRIAAQIQANNPVCSFTISSSNNFVPNDAATTNYIVISGKMKYNPLQGKTGPWPLQMNDDFLYNISRCTVQQCLDTWNNVAWTAPYTATGASTLYKHTLVIKGDQEGYYQNYTWTNDEYSTMYWPYNQNPVLNQSDMFMPSLMTDRQMFQFVASNYQKSNAVEVDNISKIPVLACELKIGDKYLTENYDYLKYFGFYVPAEYLGMIYSWKTAAEAEAAHLDTSFTLGINPAIDDYIIGKEFDIQNTVGLDMNIDAKGFAIPIPYGSGLAGQVSFKILGPVNSLWTDVGYTYKGAWFWKHDWSTTRNYKPILAYTENIQISDLKFKLYSNNAGMSADSNSNNDLVYYSDHNDVYIEEKDFDCKFCTALTSQEVHDLGVDYNLNNSTILNMDNTPFYGMTYNGETGVKLEEARVTEQYNVWNKPRNLMDVSLKLVNPELCIYKQNFEFNYLEGVYRIIARDMDLKRNQMTCKMKDFS